MMRSIFITSELNHQSSKFHYQVMQPPPMSSCVALIGDAATKYGLSKKGWNQAATV